MRFCTIIVFCLLLLGTPHALEAQAKPDPDTLGSVGHFVQEFYDWYTPRAQGTERAPAWKLALRQKGYAFDPKLLSALREDSVAQAKSPGEVVGLDFDPFLNSQDPSQRYEIGEKAERGERYWVEVYAVSSGRRSERPDVTVELSKKKGHWMFVNFHYLGNRDLLATLKSLRERRRKRPN